MSLTSFLKIPAIKDRFKTDFPLKPIKLEGEMKAKPLTTNNQLVGTAFDYLLRFHLEKINKNVSQKSWVAEQGVELTRSNPRTHKNLMVILDRAKETHLKFLKTGTMDKELIRTSLELAKLESIFRARHRGLIIPDMNDIHDKDIKDLKNLIALVGKNFKSKKITILNPSFGGGSKLVGGADADIIIDDTLIEIKTVQDLKLTKDYYFQIIGYYTLYRIGGLDGVKDPEIKNIAVYFSRHGVFHKIPVSSFATNPKFGRFIKWFKEQAEFEQKFKEDFAF